MSQPIVFKCDDIYGYVDSEHSMEIRGWICGKNSIESVSIIINGEDEKIFISYGDVREDVGGAYPHCDNSSCSGFHGLIDFLKLVDVDNIVFEVVLKNGEKVYSEGLTLEVMRVVKKLRSIESMASFVHEDVPMAQSVSHGNWLGLLEEKFNKTGFDILEVGSRDVVNASLRKRFSKANYVGFDYYPGENVDMVGDAHKLSTYFSSKKFDLIFSNAVFEHLAMPWIVSQEIVKLLKIGGHVFIETHYSYGSHSRPWHFFQFSDEALKILFNPLMGIECIESGVSNPMCGFFGSKADPYLQYKFVTGLYCHADFFGRKVREVEDYSWDKCEVGNILNNSFYPKPT